MRLWCPRAPKPVADSPSNGNQMATIFAPTRLIPGYSGTGAEESRVSSIVVRGLGQKTIERLKERARLNGRSL